jgi:hypothetical protein
MCCVAKGGVSCICARLSGMHIDIFLLFIQGTVLIGSVKRIKVMYELH